jgi:hypothetical protein
MIEVEVRESDMKVRHAVQQRWVGKQPAGARAHVEQQRSIAVADQDTARLACGGRSAAATS